MVAGSSKPKSGWSFQDERHTQEGVADKSRTRWTKATNPSAPLIQTSDGWSVDFFTDNFDVKHLIVVDSAKKFNTLLAQGKSRQAARKSGSLGDHKGGTVSPSSVNTGIVVTLDMLAAWGADIVAQFKKQKKPGKYFKGNAQWVIHSELKSAICMTHSNGATSAGMGAFVSLTLEKSGQTLFVTHLDAASFDRNRKFWLNGGNAVSSKDSQDAKRQQRFDKRFEEVDYSGLKSLFG